MTMNITCNRCTNYQFFNLTTAINNLNHSAKENLVQSWISSCQKKYEGMGSIILFSHSGYNDLI